MKRALPMTLLVALLATSAGAGEKYCTYLPDCEQGDIIIVTNMLQVAQYCDFTRTIALTETGSGKAVCVNIGNKREKRGG